MNFFRDVLKRAEKEGRIDPELLPWEKRSVPGKVEMKKKYSEKARLSIEPMEFTNEALNDFQMVIENLCSMASERKLRIIGIASAVQNQGNSTLAALFSLMMARRENGYFDPRAAVGIVDPEFGTQGENKCRRVLLIDANMRHPSLHRIFHVANEAGLSELLSEEFTVRDVAKEIELANLSLITSGGNKDFHFAKVHFNRFKSILEKSKNQNEFIFMDLPSILQYAEGITLSKLCDGVILIVCAGQTRLEIVQETKRLLEDVNVPLIGSILNRRKYYIPEWVYKRL